MALGLDSREATPGFKGQLVVLAAETRSYKRASLVMKRVMGRDVSTNTIERISLEAGRELAEAKAADWQDILTGQSVAPELAVVMTDGGRIRTRKMGCGPGVHLENEGWNETKNAAFFSATSRTWAVDPQPQPPACFLDPEHVAGLVEQGKTAEKTERGARDEPWERDHDLDAEGSDEAGDYRPRRILRTVISSMQDARRFGKQMEQEARRRRFDEAERKAYLGDGLAANWRIHAEHFADYTPVLDFVHAVSYLFTASVICFGKTSEAWSAYQDWITRCWSGQVAEILTELRHHQACLGPPPEETSEDDPREQLRVIIGYLSNNQSRMHYDRYRRAGLPVTTAWMESLVKEINYRVKGSEMFWNNPDGAEAILQIRAAALSDDDRLLRFLSHRPGRATLRPENHTPQTAA